MRRMLVVLAVAVLLLGVGLPSASAQTADSVALIASAAIAPFITSNGFVTVFEVTSLGENPNMHAIFFDSGCDRFQSIAFGMSAHDAAIASVDDFGGLNFNGLIVLARSDEGITLQPLEAPITLRTHVANLRDDILLTFDPVGGVAAEDPDRTWNGLRSGAMTISIPPGPGDTHTRWVFMCPDANVASVVPASAGFPPLPPAPNIILIRIFDLDENMVGDFPLECRCLTIIDPDKLFPGAYATESRYSELVTYVSTTPIENPAAFKMYRAIRIDAGPLGSAKELSSVPQASAASILSGFPVPLAR